MATDKRTFSKIPAWTKKPIANAVVSKLVSRQQSGHGQRQVNLGHNMLAHRISSITATNISDAAALQDLLPETELMKQILSSCILSPKDMTTTELSYGVKENTFTSQLAAPLLEVISKFFNGVYKIEERLPKIIEDCLFTKGSYPLLILPESSIDEIINKTSTTKPSVESFAGEYDFKKKTVTHLGILGNSTKAEGASGFSFESLLYSDDKSYRVADYKPGIGNTTALEEFLDIKVIDNPSVLKLPRAIDRMSRQLALQRVGANAIRSRVSTEAAKDTKEGNKVVSDSGQPKKAKTQTGMSERDIAALYKPRANVFTPVQMVTKPDDLGKPNVGHPMVMVLPPESMIPVHVPGDPEDHVGYFVLVDRNGNPINTATSTDNYRDLEKNLAMNNEQVASMLSTNMLDVNGRRSSQSEVDKMELENIYTEIVETDLLNRLRNGVYGDNVELAKAQEVYRIMLARTLAKQQTQMLYIPAELVTYIAFDYNQYGIGQSLTDKNKILGSIRAMLLFANAMAGIKNAVGRTQLNVTLDETDPNPSETVEMLVDNYMRNRGAGAPFGTINPVEIVDYMNVAAVELNVEGSPLYPQTKFGVEDKNSQKAPVDTGLEDDMRKRFIMGFGMSPETVDMGYNVEFATTIVTNNLLMAKRCMTYQNLLTPQLADFVRKYTINSEQLMDELRDVIKNNRGLVKKNLKHLGEGELETEDDQDTAVIHYFLSILELSLPKPDSGSLENQLTALDTYSKGLDAGLDAYINADYIDSSLYGDSADVLIKVKAAVKAEFLRQFMQKNNIMPELAQLVTRGDDKKPALDLMNTHKTLMDALLEGVGEFMEAAAKEKAEADKRMAKLVPDDTAGADGMSDGGVGSDGGMGDQPDDGGVDDGSDDTGGTSDDDIDNALSDDGTTDDSDSATPSDDDVDAALADDSSDTGTKAKDADIDAALADDDTKEKDK